MILSYHRKIISSIFLSQALPITAPKGGIRKTGILLELLKKNLKFDFLGTREGNISFFRYKIQKNSDPKTDHGSWCCYLASFDTVIYLQSGADETEIDNAYKKVCEIMAEFKKCEYEMMFLFKPAGKPIRKLPLTLDQFMEMGGIGKDSLEINKKRGVKDV